MDLAAAASTAPRSAAAQRNVWLDVIRALSALAVCAGHLRAAAMVDFDQLIAPGWASKAFYFLTGLGHQSVIVFFVLSGYFVGGSVLRAGHAFNPARYAITRLARLWAVLLPALLSTALVDSMIAQQAPGALQGQFAAAWGSGPNAAHPYSATFWTLLGNVFFLQTLTTPVWGSNGPLWSLAYEFWYYVCFPLLAYALGLTGRPLSTIRRLLCGVSVVALFIALPQDVRTGFLVWMVGVCVYVIQNTWQHQARPLALAGTVVLFVASLLYGKSASAQAHMTLPPDLALALACAALSAALAAWPQALANPTKLGRLFQRVAFAASEASYSLYAYHFPLVLWIAARHVGADQWTMNGAHVMAYLGFLAALLLGAAVFWWLFERQTDSLRRTAFKWLRV